PISPVRPAPPISYESYLLEDSKTWFEKDIAVPMRDGVKLYANLYRPIESICAKTPTIVLYSPFGKHGGVPPKFLDNMGVEFDSLSRYTLWENPDPLVWCAKYHYSLLIVDARATWNSEGDVAFYFSPEEGRDGYDVIEWIAKQPWNTGKVGWGAVSYFAMSAYHVASLKPPHLAAIMPWEGASDLYREVSVLGGIPSPSFQHLWISLSGNGHSRCEDAASHALAQPTFTPFWASKVVDWSRIDLPAFSVTGWSSLNLHLRGTIGAWNEFSSEKKYLWVHNMREWEAYYHPDGQRKQKAFWDRYLKGLPTEVDKWPAVELQVREDFNKVSRTLFDTQWPPRDSKLAAFTLSEGKLTPGSASVTATAPTYVSFISHEKSSKVTFDYTFTERTEIVGNSSVRLFVQALQFPDVDLFVALQKINKTREEVKFYHQTQLVEASATHGWLRASHRAKDEARSQPGRPYHSHKQRKFLRAVDVVEVEVEIWPTATVWEANETLRLVIQGRTFFNEENPVSARVAASHSYGEARVWFGGEYNSELFIPVISKAR
ncbi:unnamed protein product, partial [Clonostachys chloroleuca]